MTRCSLYYPYIRIRDVEWLKATLLIFSEVRRMTPVLGRQADDDAAIEPFTQRNGGRAPMLASANLWAPRAVAAQEALATRLRKDAEDPTFCKRFGRAATEASWDPCNLGFQIHRAKLHESLKSALRKPMNHEPYEQSQEYVELNERVGAAVMAKIALKLLR